ncbi:hypothetical protein RchiOBHm_Chr7g0216561 [Rosa chinensis]|uniref:Non-specific serine/threonine protein kinase n=1 Tax=Rosa chinensis TaxID=74649 RepID=A0A2P6PBS3_ROSCH|nr:hypothetical protein RchiOBHm_Chr7g0216561 [Rosa chinensis]
MGTVLSTKHFSLSLISLSGLLFFRSISSEFSLSQSMKDSQRWIATLPIQSEGGMAFVFVARENFIISSLNWSSHSSARKICDSRALG